MPEDAFYARPLGVELRKVPNPIAPFQQATSEGKPSEWSVPVTGCDQGSVIRRGGVYSVILAPLGDLFQLKMTTG